MIHVISQQSLPSDGNIKVESNLSSLFEYWGTRDSIQVDTETTSLLPFDGKLLTIQLGDFDNQWVVDALTVPVIQLKKLLEDKELLFQNFAFDGKWLLNTGIDVKKFYDTFLAEAVLTAGYESEERHLGLDKISKKYLNIEVSKDDRGLIHRLGLTPRVIEYCANDVKYLSLIKDGQKKEIDKYDLSKVIELENRVARPLMMMMYNGVLIDKDKWLITSEFVEEEVNKIAGRLNDIIIREEPNHPKLSRYINSQTNLFGFEESKTLINWRSPDQKKLILNQMGIQVESVNDKILQRNKKHDIVREMITFSKHAKFEDTFGKKFIHNINKTTGRIHGEIFQVLSTGRISISKPPLQQIPAHGDLAMKLKECFIAREGYTLTDTDVSGFEIIIATEFSQEPRWIEILNRGGDIHSETAMLMFDISMDKVNDPFPERPNYTYRFIAKSCNFLAMYGGNEFTLADRIQIPKPKAKALLNKYFEALPNLKRFLDMLAEAAVENGRIRSNPFYKRLRWFPKLDHSNWTSVLEVQREAMNLPMQATNADLFKECLVNLQDEIDKKGYDIKLLLQVHDAELDECRDDLLDIWVPRKEEIMIRTISQYIKSVPVKVKTTTGKHWGH